MGERQMRGHVGAVVLALLGLFCGGAEANDAAWRGIGGAVRPLRNHASVVMRSAQVRVHLASEKVECEYVFENTGPATRVLMGFPEKGWGDSRPPKATGTHFRGFRSWVDGKEVRVEPRPPAERDGYERVWVKEVPFSARQTRKVRNTYIGGGGGDIAGTSSFHYELSPAASWKGKVGATSVEVDLAGMEGFTLLEAKPEGYTRSGTTIRWQWRNIEPQSDISVSYFTGYDGIWVDGVKRSPREVSLGGANPYPQLRAGVLMVRCNDLAEWLGLHFSQEAGEDGQQKVVLATEDKRLVLFEGRDQALADGQSVKLAAPAQRLWFVGDPVLFAPLKSVAEAFGAQVRFDPATKRTHVHTARARASAPAPA